MATTHYGITREEHGDDCAGIRATGAPTRVGHLPGPSGDARAMDAGADCCGQGAVVSARDKVIATMKRTGDDMAEIYKETSMGGLAVGMAVNRVEC